MRRAPAVIFAIGFVFLSGPSARAVEPPVELKPIQFVPPQADRAVLSNGVVVYLEENHELPIFDMIVLIKATPADERPEHAFELLSEVWRSGGTGNRPPDRLDEELESMAASVESGAAPESLSLSVSCLSREIPKALDIWADVLLNPAFADRKLALAKGQMLESIRRRNETPGQIGRRLFRRVIYGKEHVYADQPVPADVKRVSRKHLAAIHRRVVVPRTAVIAVAGDFDRASLLAGLEKRLAGWTGGADRDLSYDFSIKGAPSGTVFLVDRPFSQSRISIGRVGISRLDPDRFRVAVADYILGGGGPSRLFGEIRSRLGLAYMVGSFVYNPKGPGMTGVVSQTKGETTIALIDAVLAEMKRFSERPVSRDELDLAKSSLINSNVFGFDSPFEIAKAHATREFYGYPEDELSGFSKRIAAVSAGDVLTMAEKYFRPEGAKIAVVGDSERFGGKLDRFGPVTVIPLEQLD